ncbi:MAG TPA: type II toxin-antitoxin system prevent-host-death family antitoxin [Caulobacterales bacterium]|jgi:prevent-host-death family protein|nr:type II toxin-antitoxin system prevent-host-death family antitoxin [Caulobacterales bacterium]
MEKVNIAEARRRLKELVDRAAGGETILIARDGAPAARLMPANDVAQKKPYFDAELARKRLEALPMDSRPQQEIIDERKKFERF